MKKKRLLFSFALAALAISILACTLTVQKGVEVRVTPSSTSSPLAIPSPSPLPTVTATQTEIANARTALVLLPTVYVRDVPDGAVVATVTSGSSVEIVTCEESWCQIVEPAGWIWRGCLSDNPDGLGCSSR